MSIFGTLSLGKQALLAHQRAIQVASRNISNANTPGYSRQRAIFEPEPTVPVAGGVSTGGGVSLDRVQRIVDLGIEAQLQREKQNGALFTDLQAGLERVENVFGDLNGAGLDNALSGFFNAVNGFAAEPNDASSRETLLRSAENLVRQIGTADTRLSEIQRDANEKIPADIDEINGLAQNIAQINGQIVEREFGTNGGFSELRDERQVLLQQLGEKIDVTSFEREDGSLAVFAAGGFALVDGSVAGGLTTSTNQPTPLGDPTFVNVFHTLNGSVNGPITSRITGGSLAATISLRDDRVPFYREQLDSFAFSLAERVNSVHLAGRGLEDDSARNLFVDSAAAGANPPGPTLTSVLGAARRITLNPDIVANSRHLAAGQPAAGAASAGDNSNALALAEVREQQSAFFVVGDPVTGPATGSTQTLSSFFSKVAGTLGSELGSVKRSAAQSELVTSELEDRRGQISGVSLDEEVADLIRFQRGFEASARIIRVADELLQQLLAI
jgi:flagellar hook-associated protein 1